VRKSGRSGLTVFDTLLVCILVSALIVGFATYYGKMVREARETALKVDLANMRSSIQFYQMNQGRNPSDLPELLLKRYLIPTKEGTIFNNQYLLAQTIDFSGYPVDPFGQRYRYDPATGSVKSRNRDYEDW
jgi:type II secretory pathway pseudopilin PulG